jgi:hypothetical protein
MDPSSLPLDDGEHLLRRFQAQDYNTTKQIPTLGAFLPNKNDKDGLSLFRERCQSAPAVLATARSPVVRETGGVAAVEVSLLKELGLTPEPDLGDPEGHVLIKELNRADYDASEDGANKIKALADELIRRANKPGFVRIPPRRPAK